MSILFNKIDLTKKTMLFTYNYSNSFEDEMYFINKDLNLI